MYLALCHATVRKNFKRFCALRHPDASQERYVREMNKSGSAEAPGLIGRPPSLPPRRPFGSTVPTQPSSILSAVSIFAFDSRCCPRTFVRPDPDKLLTNLSIFRLRSAPRLPGAAQRSWTWDRRMIARRWARVGGAPRSERSLQWAGERYGNAPAEGVGPSRRGRSNQIAPADGDWGVEWRPAQPEDYRRASGKYIYPPVSSLVSFPVSSSTRQLLHYF